MQLKLVATHCVYLLLLSICYALDKDLPGPENMQISLEFVNNASVITVTWDPPVISGDDPEIKSYQVAIINNSSHGDSQQPWETYTINNQTTTWKILNTSMLAKYYASVRIRYTTGYSEAINTSSIDIRYLQNFTVQTSRNRLRAECHLAKSDLLVDCQIVILNDKKKTEVLSPVNIVQSNFSILLPSSDNRFLVTARAVIRPGAGAMAETEMFNISYIIVTTTPKSTSLSDTGNTTGTDEMCEETMLTPLAIWLIIIILLILLVIIISLIFITLHKAIFKTKRKPLSKSKAIVPPVNHSNHNLTHSTSISQQSDLILKGTPSVQSQRNLRNGSYENVPDYPKPSNIRHSHIQIVECPAYRTANYEGNSGEDYDDIQSTAVIMQPNPSYEHKIFSHCI